MKLINKELKYRMLISLGVSSYIYLYIYIVIASISGRSPIDWFTIQYGFSETWTIYLFIYLFIYLLSYLNKKVFYSILFIIFLYSIFGFLNFIFNLGL